ncbi:HD domain-containing phosphohydrolase [Rhabdochromatium marinum]|uniref:HD domain-containing phosphohydrolase n=1 Tax=Rhabdochromatium marinum TaxID=48729 RepID=UPI001907A368|nr:HD domain-containing phosphohydrolase [Rhabdochromatium marinum]MBK1647224.1 hypothetical protein [Rhabdochromatium marinum]
MTPASGVPVRAKPVQAKPSSQPRSQAPGTPTRACCGRAQASSLWTLISSGSPDAVDLLEQNLEAATLLTGTDCAVLAFPDADGRELVYRCIMPLSAAPADRAALQVPFASTTSLAGEALRTGQARSWPPHQDPTQDRNQHPHPQAEAGSDPLLRSGARSLLACPVIVQEQVQAVLCVASWTETASLTPEQMRRLTSIARQISLVIDRERLITTARISNRQLDEIIQRNPDAILITDDYGCVRFANIAAQRLFARNAQELTGYPLGLTSQRSVGEIEVHCSTGQRIPVELHAMETTWDGQRAHVLTLRDLTARRQIENERRASANRLRAALVQTIEAISRTVETRDPYTAGHQRRVAALGREIARAMELDQSIVDGVYMGGTIHDIGKLYIPAEILNRPGKLNEAEFMLIRTHSSVGYDIIADIDFPWPLAKMVHQHHERIDGNGYPQGLKGGEIILQARILAVADVVDAMSSRRPYREALGLDAALEEIERGSGTRYDPEAVAACIRLFTQQNLRLEDLEAIP